MSLKKISFNLLNSISFGILNGDRSALARGITLAESNLPEHKKLTQDLLKLLHTSNINFNKENKLNAMSLRIGITGSPGVGKSSLIERLGMHCITKEGLKVATLAIDPTSQKSGGSILGDKTRMQELANHPAAFVRPSPSGGQLGGVSRGTFCSVKMCERAGYDVVFVESVGVGQSEVQLADLTDIFVLCVSPFSGDEIQAMKRGISEMADLVLLNKAEEPLSWESRKALTELKSSQTFRKNPCEVLPVSAIKGSGIEASWTAIKKIQDRHKETGEFEKRRKNQEMKWFDSFIKNELIERFDAFAKNKDFICKYKTENDDDDGFNYIELTDEIIKSFCEKEITNKNTNIINS